MKNNERPTSKQRYDEMMARLAAKEAQIEKRHQEYLKIMKHYDEAGR